MLKTVQRDPPTGVKSFKYQARVAWAETDAAQVAHFSNYFRYFEKAEQELYNQLRIDPFGAGKELKMWLPRVEASCKYSSPCRLNDLIEVELTIPSMGSKSIQYEFIINNLTTGREAAKGRVVVVSASVSEGHAIELPEGFAAGLKNYLGL